MLTWLDFIVSVFKTTTIGERKTQMGQDEEQIFYFIIYLFILKLHLYLALLCLFLYHFTNEKKKFDRGKDQLEHNNIQYIHNKENNNI